jgi:hypothetical protein
MNQVPEFTFSILVFVVRHEQKYGVFDRLDDKNVIVT